MFERVIPAWHRHSGMWIILAVYFLQMIIERKVRHPIPREGVEEGVEGEATTACNDPITQVKEGTTSKATPAISPRNPISQSNLSTLLFVEN